MPATSDAVPLLGKSVNFRPLFYSLRFTGGPRSLPRGRNKLGVFTNGLPWEQWSVSQTQRQEPVAWSFIHNSPKTSNIATCPERRGNRFEKFRGCREIPRPTYLRPRFREFRRSIERHVSAKLVARRTPLSHFVGNLDRGSRTELSNAMEPSLSLRSLSVIRTLDHPKALLFGKLFSRTRHHVLLCH